MTVREAIERAKALHPSTFTDELLLAWLNECEGSIQKEIFRIPQTDIVKHEFIHTESGEAVIAGGEVTLPRVTEFRIGESVNINGAEATVENIDFFKTTLTLSGFSGGGTEFVTITANRENDELLVQYPHDKLYPEYIGARIRYNNGEYEEYQNIVQTYNSFYKEFAAWWQRTYGSRRVI